MPASGMIDIVAHSARPYGFLALFALAGIYAIYRWILLPRPLAGIPYDPAAAKKILGDVPSLRSDPNGLAEWCSKQLGKLQSPICQALMGPDFLQKPIVLVADVAGVRETMLQRTEFDRSQYLIDRFPLFGDFHLNMKTNEDWKLARHWVKDLLTPQYMNDVATPAIEMSATRLIELWEGKSRVAKGKVFDMIEDVKGMSIDVILAFFFGDDREDSMMVREIERMKKLDDSMLVTGNHSAEVVFPRAEPNRFTQNLIDIGNRITSLYASAWPPALAAWWTRHVSPRFRIALSEKDKSVQQLIERAVERTARDEESIRSGLDHMIWREGKAAAKSGRNPKFSKQVMIDETYGMLIAGQHTTSAAMVWMLKYLAGHPTVQTKLRNELQAVCVAAAQDHRLPTANEIVASIKQLPYLRAVIEEMLRLRQAMIVPRDATRDTELLGCRIPAGTVLLLICQNPDPRTLKSVDGKPARAPHQFPGESNQDMSAFDPERWLVRGKDGHTTFDGSSYPQLAFGAGVRACWGRKLADLEMQIVTALLVWRFDFLEVPEALATHAATYDITYRADQGYVNLRSRAL